MHSGMSPDAFLDDFIVSDDEVKNRCLSFGDFGAPLDTENNDVPLQDMYNRGLALTQEGRERTNLQIDGGERCGLTGIIPSMEEGMTMGANPRPRGMIMDLGEADGDEMKQSLKRRGLSR